MTHLLTNRVIWLSVVAFSALAPHSHAHPFSICELTEPQVDVLLEEAAETSTRVRVGDPDAVKNLAQEVCSARLQDEKELSSLFIKIEGMSQREEMQGKKVLSTSPLAMLLLIEILAGNKNNGARQSTDDIK